MLRRAGWCLYVFVVLTAVSLPLLAESKRIWSCAAQGSPQEDLHLVEWGERSYVKLYDARIWGNQYAEGENLRWDFGQGKGNTAKFSVILKPDGLVDYYDFSSVGPGEAVEAAYHYTCRLAQG